MPIRIRRSIKNIRQRAGRDQHHFLLVMEWVADLEWFHPKTLRAVRLAVGDPRGSSFSEEDFLLIREAGWFVDLPASPQATLARGTRRKLREDVSTILEAVVELKDDRILLHHPLPEDHLLYHDVLQCLKQHGAHVRGALVLHFED